MDFLVVLNFIDESIDQSVYHPSECLNKLIIYVTVSVWFED